MRARETYICLLACILFFFGTIDLCTIKANTWEIAVFEGFAVLSAFGFGYGIAKIWGSDNSK